MNKFLSIISLFLFSFGMFNVSYAECDTIYLTCTQDLELRWTSTGQDPSFCEVAGGGWNGSNECNSQNVSGSNSGWVRIPSANIPEGTSYYTFSGRPIVQPPENMTDTCTIVKETGCNPSGSYSISANPNPVKICSPATTGSSNISWTAPAGQNVVVWVVGNPNMFANVIGSGSQIANWIQVGVPATFELKKHNSSTVEATVTVTGTSNGCSTGSGYCGDLIKQTPNSSGVNEQCDAGSQNGVPGSGCSSTCTTVSGSVCGNDIREGDEECDDGNTQNGDACSSVCTNETTQSANLGWNSTNYFNDGGTVIIPAGQTTTDKTIYWKIEGYANCSIQKKTGWSYPGTWSQVTSGISGTGSLLLTNLATTTQSRPHRYRIGCSTNSSFQIMDGHEAAGDGPVQFYVENAPLSSMNIGWTNSYSPKSKTVTVATGGTTNESLYVTTGGRTGCSLTGYMSSSNQVGVSPVSTTVGFAYNVSAPQSPTQYTYTLSCAGQTPVSATLTVNSSATGPSVSCVPSPQAIPSGGSATFSWSASGFSKQNEVTCTVAEVPQSKGKVFGSFSKSVAGTYPVSCSTETQSASVDCVATEAGLCTSGACSADCPANCTTDNSSCVGEQAIITSPVNQRVISGQLFTVSFRFQNIGQTTWTNPTYQVSTTLDTYSSWHSVFGTKSLSPSPIAGILGGSGQTDSYSQQFTAPIVSSETSFPLAFTVTKSGAAFGETCSTGDVTVYMPQCSDGIDNDSDGKKDCTSGKEDPGCFPDGNGGGGACNSNDDDETDNTGTNMSITANPQLVRQNGTSDVSFTCGATTWSVIGPQVGNINSIVRDTTTSGCTDANVFCGTGVQTNKVFSVTNIQQKETYTLRCGGKERSATISVIKINEI